MSKVFKPILFIIPILSVLSCTDSKEEITNVPDLNGWEVKKHVTKQINNIEFIFLDHGYAYENRDSLVEECMVAIEENMNLIEVDTFDVPYKFVFYPSKADMQYDINVRASGHADYWIKEVGFVCTDNPETIKEENIIPAPIKHETMHMIAMESWGFPAENSQWLNEGLATYAANNCNGLKVDEVYSYLLSEDMLISTDSLSQNFLETDEMIAYHQSAYVVQYLIENYGLEKFILIWRHGFVYFEQVYEVPFSEVEALINDEIRSKYPTPISIDWENFKKGCK